MTDAQDHERVAPAPTEWGKSLRCCVPCRLVKTFDQFYDQGCDNCPFLGMEGDRERVFDCTTTEFKASAPLAPQPLAGRPSQAKPSGRLQAPAAAPSPQPVPP